MARRRNPFVKRHKVLTPVLTFGWPELYKYGEWSIEVTRWPESDPTEWRVKATDSTGVEQFQLFSTVGKQDALRAMKIQLDLTEQPEEAEDLWAYLHSMMDALPRDRPTLARFLEMERRRLRGLPLGEGGVTTAREAVLDWFYAQPSDYRIGFLDRFLEFEELLIGPPTASNPQVPHGAVRPRASRLSGGTTRKSRPGRAQTNAPVVNTRSLKSRLLR